MQVSPTLSSRQSDNAELGAFLRRQPRPCRDPVFCPSPAEVGACLYLSSGSPSLRAHGILPWSTRTLAKKLGVSRAMVHRVWQANGLKPHLYRTFKLSNDPDFDPREAMVFSVDGEVPNSSSRPPLLFRSSPAATAVRPHPTSSTPFPQVACAEREPKASSALR